MTYPLDPAKAHVTYPPAPPGKPASPAEPASREPHCSQCGEAVYECLPAGQPSGAVREWRHASGYARCVIATVNGLPVALAPECAEPCGEEGCPSNAEHDAARGRAGAGQD